MLAAAGREYVRLHGRDRCRGMDTDAYVAECFDAGFVATDDVPAVKYQFAFDVQRQRPRVQKGAREGYAAIPAVHAQPLDGNRRFERFLEETAAQPLWMKRSIWPLTLFEVAGGARRRPGKFELNEFRDFGGSSS